MITGNEPAYPLRHDPADCRSIPNGLTIRQFMATMILQGIMSQSHQAPNGTKWTNMGWGWGEDVCNHLNKFETAQAHTIAGFAVQLTDILIAALNKKEEEKDVQG